MACQGGNPDLVRALLDLGGEEQLYLEVGAPHTYKASWVSIRS
jgi:hypothetical protein